MLKKNHGVVPPILASYGAASAGGSVIRSRGRQAPNPTGTNVAVTHYIYVVLPAWVVAVPTVVAPSFNGPFCIDFSKKPILIGLNALTGHSPCGRNTGWLLGVPLPAARHGFKFRQIQSPSLAKNRKAFGRKIATSRVDFYRKANRNADRHQEACLSSQ